MRQQAGMVVTRMQARCRTVGAAAGKFGSRQDASQVQVSRCSRVRQAGSVLNEQIKYKGAGKWIVRDSRSDQNTGNRIG
ncbi:unnamed protein product [Staurois parvus]|uniref:Uncharacterized protein n=1 Tax=Staurois parvus TaxID=386267 RepID=A0ABN9DS08_9NEOB|nr:unnamed protein product [Staurois parvus]